VPVAAFSPTGLLGNPHFQTLLAAWPATRRPPEGAYLEPLHIPLGAAGALHAAGLFQRGEQPRPTALLVHGVGGTSDSASVGRTSLAIARAGFHAVSLDQRGVGLGAPLASSLYHAGLTDDLDAALASLAADRRVGPVLLVGFSLGGQLSLLAASRWGSAPPAPLRAVAAVSPPFDLDAASRLIELPRAFPYKAHVLRALVAGALALKRRAPQSLAASSDQLRSLRSIRAYDELVVAPMHGFASAHDYYARTSCGPRLRDIRVPTLVIAAEDDPMVPAHTLRPFLSPGAPRSPAPSSADSAEVPEGAGDWSTVPGAACVEVLWSRRGGHVGFVERLPGGLVDSWANARLVSLLASLTSPA
jgi:uncharacterized protein